VGQVQQIQRITADVDYLEAKKVYQQVEKLLEDARRKFERAKTYGTGKFATPGSGRAGSSCCWSPSRPPRPGA